MTAPVSPVSAEELRPCPFCGAEPLLQEIAPHTHNIKFGDWKMPDHHGSWTIECPACECGMIADTQEKVTSSWNRRSPAASGATPDGYALVPIEPTQEMRTAGNDRMDRLNNEPGRITADRAYYAYRAMIAAAPLPPDPNAGNDKEDA